jgi:hypothetical protein
MTHHEGHHGHAPHPGGFEHHRGECPYCKHGEFKSKQDEISALENFKKDIGEQLKNVDRRIEELRKG